jgi:ferredoxin
MSRYCITIDAHECIGYGRCVELSPEHFELHEGVAASVTAESDDPAVLDAAAECPMSAITVEEVAAA